MEILSHKGPLKHLFIGQRIAKRPLTVIKLVNVGVPGITIDSAWMSRAKNKQGPQLTKNHHHPIIFG